MKEKVPFVQSRNQEGSTYLAICIQKLESCDLPEDERAMPLKGVCIPLQEGF